MDDKVKEILLITQEECAEVTQAISKVFRFGFDDCWPRGEDWVPTNKERLEEEVGDLLCMIDIIYMRVHQTVNVHVYGKQSCKDAEIVNRIYIYQYTSYICTLPVHAFHSQGFPKIPLAF